MSTRRVVVTGMGVVAPNAHGLANFSQALRQGQSGLRHQPELEQLKFGCQVAGVPQNIDNVKTSYFSPDELMAMNTAITFACHAGVVEALRPAAFRSGNPVMLP